LFHWRNVLESGVDDNLALLAPIEAAKGENEDLAKFPDGQILAADLNAYLVAEFSALAKLCQFVKETALAEKYRALEDRTKTLIESKLFDPSIGMYSNYDPVSNTLISLRSWTGLVPVMLGIAHNERARIVIEQNVMDSKHFLRPAGLASYAASESLYNQAPRGLYGRVKVSNWQGPMWILPNALMVRELLRSGYGQQATEIAVRVLRTMLNDVEVNGTLHENYHAETGQPLWAPSFMSWNILALELLELVS
jgi:neutral trehalase